MAFPRKSFFLVPNVRLILRQDAFVTEQECLDYLDLCAVLLPHTKLQQLARVEQNV